MVSTAPVTNTQAYQDAAQTQQQASGLAQDFNDFLILLTTQLQNQDPLNPTDSTEFTNQLVQFSQVEQAINTNQKLDSLLNMQISNGLGSATNYIGLDITYPSVEMNFDGETPVKLSYFLEEVPFNATLNIRDEKGNVVFTKEVDREIGKNDFVWDGKNNGGEPVEEGTYNFSIDALDKDGDAVENITTIVNGRVSGVENQNGVTFLIVGERAVMLQNVLNAAQPTDYTTASGDDSTGDDNTGDDNTTEGEDS
jgi:flagellar basal-body rod modification protein FlgD